ncbi:MAG: metal ABC transporter permease [Bdellovibrionales bacterium]|nr:metal ABC transporter permease [Bdellovibrionales bacterium]
MNDFASLMLRPLIACFVLTGIHAYLGFHVIQRGVIFVDLALAQVAALGTTIGFLLGYGLHTTGSYLIALTFTVLVAAIFSLLRSENSEVPQEAYIGILYAVASAASILVLSAVPDGGEELKGVLVGHILFIGWGEIVKISLIYGSIALVHWYFRKQMWLVTYGSSGAEISGFNVKGWDFLFYVTFGVVVTSSVEVAGVLLVFSFLIVPSVCGVLLGRSLRTRLLIGWLCGFFSSTAGIFASYLFDLPTGACVVCAFGLSVAVCLFLRQVQIQSGTISLGQSLSEIR